LNTEHEKLARTEKEGVSEKDKEESMDVDKKPCEDSTANTQSTTANRNTEEEPERIVKVSVNFIIYSS